MRSKTMILVSIYALFHIAAWTLWWHQNKLVAKGFAVAIHIPFNASYLKKQVKPVFFS